MNRARLEAFSDGVIAILITIMILEMKIPPTPDLAGLRAIVPQLLIYVLSYSFLGIYWNNHHHMLHMATSINGKIMWANLHLLFWLSLVPFATEWMDDSHFVPLTVACYGVVLLLSAIAYSILQHVIIAAQGKNSILATAVGKDTKGKLSIVFYVGAIGLAFVSPWIAIALYVVVAMMWLVPDRRIEKRLETIH